MKTAKLKKDNLESFTGHAALYELSKPLKGYNSEKYKFVVCSTASCMGVVETYVFGADKNGEVLNWGELDGNMKNTSSHTEVLNEAGYELIV